jgi:archaellum biogenesis ATPase FlaH
MIEQEVESILAEHANEVQTVVLQQKNEASRVRLVRAEEYEEKIKNAEDFFDDGFPVGITRDTYLLVAARTGAGKTTFAKQAAAYALKQGKKVAIFSNEMTAASYDSGIYHLMGASLHTKEEKDAHWFTYSHNLFVYDTASSAGQLICWDAAFSFVDSKNTQEQFDLIIFDQISNLTSTYTEANKKKASKIFEQLKYFSNEAKERINKKDNDFPPLVVFQQSEKFSSEKNPSEVDIKQILRGCKSTIDDATLAIYVDLRTNESNTMETFIVIDKNRYGLPYKPEGGRCTRWHLENNWLSRKAKQPKLLLNPVKTDF